MNQWQRRRLALLLAVAVVAGVGSVVVLSYVQPGNCPVAEVMDSAVPAGCQPARMLWLLHVTVGLLVAVLAVYGTHNALAARRRRRDRGAGQ